MKYLFITLIVPVLGFAQVSNTTKIKCSGKVGKITYLLNLELESGIKEVQIEDGADLALNKTSPVIEDGADSNSATSNKSLFRLVSNKSVLISKNLVEGYTFINKHSKELHAGIFDIDKDQDKVSLVLNQARTKAVLNIWKDYFQKFSKDLNISFTCSPVKK